MSDAVDRTVQDRTSLGYLPLTKMHDGWTYLASHPPALVTHRSAPVTRRLW